MIGIYGNFRKLCDQFQRLAQYILRRNILRVIVICIKGENTALHSVHNVCIGTFHNNITNKAATQIFHIEHHIQKSGEFIFVRKFAKDQKINRFFEAKTSAFQTTDNVLYIDSLIV